jgi:hypothetical protein
VSILTTVAMAGEDMITAFPFTSILFFLFTIISSLCSNFCLLCHLAVLTTSRWWSVHISGYNDYNGTTMELTDDEYHS